MKSNVFSHFDPGSENNELLGKHLRFFLGLDADKQAALLLSFRTYLLVITKSETEKAIEDAEKKTQCTGVEVSNVFTMLKFFINRMMKPETRIDTFQEWAEDLIRIGFLSQPEVKSFIHWMDELKSQVLPEVEQENARREAAQGVFPFLNSVGVTVELRAIQEDRYRWGTSIEDYESKIVDFVGVASVHIGVDSGLTQDFYFQVDEEGLEMLINSLHATQSDLCAIKAKNNVAR